MRKTNSLFLLNALLFFVSSLTGCAGLVRGEIEINKLAHINNKERILVLLSHSEHLTDLSLELAKYNMRIKPLAREARSKSAVVKGGMQNTSYEISKYGIQIDKKFDQNCAFTPASIYAFTVTVIDIETNEILMVIRQTGADGPCTTVNPVWPTLANAIYENWN